VKAIPLKGSEVMRGYTINVTVTGLRTMMFRLWLATRIFRFGAWVAGVGIQFNADQDDAEQC
jgi:hypothetical protein